MALSTASIHRVRGRPPLLAAGITSLIHSHSSSVKSLGYVFSFIYLCYTTYEDFSDRLLEEAMSLMTTPDEGQSRDGRRDDTPKEVYHLARVFERAGAYFMWTTDLLAPGRGW